MNIICVTIGFIVFCILVYSFVNISLSFDVLAIFGLIEKIKKIKYNKTRKNLEMQIDQIMGDEK